MSQLYKNLIIIAVLAAWQAHAALFTSPTDLVLSVDPEFPRPGENFTVEAKSFAFDLGRGDIRWFLNEKLAASGKGTVKNSFVAGPLGSTMNIEVDAMAEDGIEYSAKLNIVPSDIDIIIRPITYAPLFYRGASLASPGSELEIYAVPHLFSGASSKKNRILSQNIVYRWFSGSSELPVESGTGKNKLAVQLPDVGGSGYDFSVEAGSLDGKIKFKKTIAVKTREPEVLFYETNSLTGQKIKALNAFNAFAGDAFSIIAEPYYFDLASLAKAAIKWAADGEELKSAAGSIKNRRLLELTAPSGTESQSNFTLSISDESTIFQRVEAALSVTASQ